MFADASAKLPGRDDRSEQDGETTRKDGLTVCVQHVPQRTAGVRDFAIDEKGVAVVARDSHPLCLFPLLSTRLLALLREIGWFLRSFLHLWTCLLAIGFQLVVDGKKLDVRNWIGSSRWPIIGG